MNRKFVEQIEQFAADEQIDLITTQRGERKDDLAKDYLASHKYEEGGLFVGKAQEKARVLTQRRTNSETGATCPWLYRSTVMVNRYCFSIYDRDFGPMFLIFCSYFPYSVKFSINGNEWLKCQLDKREIEYQALDNGILSCDDPKQVQKINLDLGRPDKVQMILGRCVTRRTPGQFNYPRTRGGAPQ